MTDLALRGSRYINGVALSHWEVSRGMFPGYPLHSITNGIHAGTWVSPPFAALYDRYLPDWRRDAFSLRYAVGIPLEEIWGAHAAAKRVLVEQVNREANAGFDRDVLTLGFARRATAYKRATLVFHDVERLAEVAGAEGSVQLVFAGKAHPRDEEGKQMIRRVHRARDRLRGRVPVAYLANHDMALAKLLCAGVDVWLNTPLAPREASGTSGMKAAANGVPSLSVLDGWWVEGHAEGLTGWSIGGRPAEKGGRAGRDDGDAKSLYDKLARDVVPRYYRERVRFMEMMRSTIALNAAFFNTHRMVWQYFHCAYRLAPDGGAAPPPC